MRWWAISLGMAALLVAACGGGSTRSSAGSGAGGNAPAAAGTGQLSTAAPGGQAAAAIGSAGTVDCARAWDALTTVGLHMQFFYQLYNDAQYKDLVDPALPIRIEPDRLAAALDSLDAVPAFKELATNMRRMLAQYRTNAVSGRPWSDGSGGGALLQRQAGDGILQPWYLGTSDRMKALGCPPR